jgi:hypothetical protein
MNYKELATEIAKFSEEQLLMDVTIQKDSEFYAATLLVVRGDDRLDDNHPVLLEKE